MGRLDPAAYEIVFVAGGTAPPLICPGTATLAGTARLAAVGWSGHLIMWDVMWDEVGVGAGEPAGRGLPAPEW